MKSIVIALLLGLAFLPPVTAHQRSESTQPPPQRLQLTRAQQQAVDELNEAARAYHDGDFAEAQLHSEKALFFDPANKTAPLFIARTTHAQYKPGDYTDANVAKGREAIDAYKRILTQDSRNEEAYKAIAYLYGALKEDNLLRGWVFQRAVDPTFSDEQRAEAFIVLASRDWDCSFKITALPSNQITTIKGHTATVHYKKPKDPAEFAKAQHCANEGLDLIESAINLSPGNETAWIYKKELLLELARLAEMVSDSSLKTEYTNQANAAQRTTEEIKSRKVGASATKP